MPALEFKGPIEGYVVNYLNQNFWKVERSMEWADIMQEAYCVYLDTNRRYPDVVDAPHFMTLFKRCWHSAFTNLTKKDTKHRYVCFESDDEDTANLYEPVGDTDNAGYTTILLEEAPSEVRQVLALFLNAPNEVVELIASAWRKPGKKREAGNRRINRFLGFPENTDALGQVEDYLMK